MASIVIAFKRNRVISNIKFVVNRFECFMCTNRLAITALIRGQRCSPIAHFLFIAYFSFVTTLDRWDGKD